MARLVRHDAKGAIKIEPSDKPIWVCACGLSGSFPLCDKSHKACAAEQDGRLYAYGPGNVAQDVGSDPGPAPPQAGASSVSTTA